MQQERFQMSKIFTFWTNASEDRQEADTQRAFPNTILLLEKLKHVHVRVDARVFFESSKFIHNSGSYDEKHNRDQCSYP